MTPTAPAACPDCDLLQTLPPLPAGARAHCARCGCTLARTPRHGHDLPLALTLTAAIVFVVANTSPLLGLSAVGRSASTTLAGGALAMWQQGQGPTAALVLFCMVLAPGLFLAALLALQLAARRPRLPAWCGAALRLATALHPWAMFEVMLLGTLVALIKIAELAHVEAGLGLYAVALLTMLFPAILVNLDEHGLWSRIAWRQPASGSATTGRTDADTAAAPPAVRGATR